MTPAMRVALTVRQAPGGGVRRDELARLVRLDPSDQRFRTALMIAYSRKVIDFIGTSWVVSVPKLRAAHRHVHPVLRGDEPG